MSASFSQRMGFVKIPDAPISDSVSKSLRMKLWNVFYVCVLKRNETAKTENSSAYNLLARMWINIFVWDVDNLPYMFNDCIIRVKTYFFDCSWHELMTLIEFVSNQEDRFIDEHFRTTLNNVFEEEFFAYRLVEGKIVEIQSKEEMDEISTAIRNTPFPSVKEHLAQSLKHLSDIKHPDYRNSMKESISAVEALCKKITKNDTATLGDALKIMEKDHSLHPALKDAFFKLYGYTSNADGIRHGLMDESDLSQSDARFMLITCSAFTNYLIDKNK